MDEDPNIKFIDNISEIKIKPALDEEEKKSLIKSEKNPKDYGLRVYSKNKIEKVTIKYKYFGLVFYKECDLEHWNK